jgi:hypothetical protein
MSAGTKMTAAIDRRLRAIVTFGRLAKPHSQFNELQAPGDDSSDNPRGRQDKPDASVESAEATHSGLPIGPACC